MRRIACIVFALATACAVTTSREATAAPATGRSQVALAISTDPTPADIFKLRAFSEPLVPVGGEPSASENRALAAALQRYAGRAKPDDFSSLTDFLQRHPASSWRAALLLNLGFEYYNSARYSLALEAWEKSWQSAKAATDARGKAIADQAAGEFAYMLARLGRMTELEALLKSVEGRTFVGAATERIGGAREGLWNMQNRPEISFRCGPLALHRIKLATNPQGPGDMEIFNSASTQRGFSLPQVAELSRKIRLNFQMAFREKAGAFVVPSVVHWKVGHYAAMVRQEGDRYLLEDPTFGNTVWATRKTLEEETSGYFLLPPDALPGGWRAVEVKEGEAIWGKGNVGALEPGSCGTGDPGTGGAACRGMAVSSVHLMLVNLNLSDEPVGYSPPVGPAIRFTVRYNHRDAAQPGTFTYFNFGQKWTCDWLAYIVDNPQSLLADVTQYLGGGGTRAFTGFNSTNQTFAFQQKDQTRLTRTSTSPISYELVSGDGSKLVFAQSDGSVGFSRKVFLTQIVDPFGNTVALAYDGNLRLTAITDAIGQVTTLSYTNADIHKITRVTDPFGRFASFDYDASGRLTNITDVIGMSSRFAYEGSGDFINALLTPYGTTTFTRGGAGTTRWLETLYPDGSRDRVEFNQSTGLGIPDSLPASQVPQGMSTFNAFLYARNTYYWSRNACATAYGDYTKARIYHWLHAPELATAAGILESLKEPLEGRVWYGYAGQSVAHTAGNTDLPRHVGRVLDDGQTQLSTYEYNGFGHLTNVVDPLGRTFSRLYASNGMDLLEIRQTRAGNNELLFSATYDSQHLPLMTTDAAGQTTTNTYNARGQLLITSNPKGETTTYTYDTNGYLIAVDGPLPGTNDMLTVTYDSFGRTQTRTDESGYTVTLAYDVLNRITNITYPDATFDQFSYNRLDVSAIRDRAGRQTFLEHDALGNMVKRTDPLGRVTQFQWCNCGSIKSLTDPMGRTTEWQMDVQGRLAAKQYGDGSKVSYFYENASGRLRQVVDERLQVKQFTYNRDNTLRAVSYLNAAVPTPATQYTHDSNYERQVSMTDGTGTTLYSYSPITGSPALGAGQLASVDGPLPNDTITYGYDELGRRVSTAINGVASLLTYDVDGRVVGETNALGSFTYAYDGSSGRVALETFPNGQTTTNVYGDNLHDQVLQRITHKIGATPLSEFIYSRDIAANRIMTWSQQAGASAPDLYTFGFDAADQLLSATVTNAGSLINTFAYGYDPAGNRLTEQIGASNYTASYNALNQLSTITGPGLSRTNEWNAEDRLTAVITGNQRTELAYDGKGRLVSVRSLTNGVQASFRWLLWCDNKICEERDELSTVTKRFFQQGTKVQTGTNIGSFFHTRDHLGSIRETTDGSGNIRARYAYSPFGRRVQLSGDVTADFGFAGMFFATETGLSVARFRAYDSELGRWLSRDPLRGVEISQGPNLYAYVGNNPVGLVDPLGLCCETERLEYEKAYYGYHTKCQNVARLALASCAVVEKRYPDIAQQVCAAFLESALELCARYRGDKDKAWDKYWDCTKKPCEPCIVLEIGDIQIGNAP